MAKQETKDPYLLSSLSTALSLLDLLSHHPRLTLAEVCAHSGLNKTVAFRSLYTLEKGGYVEKSPDGAYSLGIKFLYYGGLVLQRQDVLAIARPHLQSLALKCKIAAHLSNRNDTRVVTLQKEESPYDLQVTARVGMNAPLHTTAMGRVLLAWTPPEELETLAKKFTYKRYSSNSITSDRDLLHCLQKVRLQGFATDLDDRFPGFGSIACPIFDHTGAVAYAIGLVGLSQVIQSRQEEFRSSLSAAARDISLALGCPPSAFPA